MRKCKDYCAVWRVEFTERFSSNVFTAYQVSAWTVEEAIKKAYALSKKNDYGNMQITSVVRKDIIDA